MPSNLVLERNLSAVAVQRRTCIRTNVITVVMV